MKIAIVIEDLSIPGGAQRQALELVHALRAQGDSVDVFCRFYDAENCFPSLLVDVRCTAFGGKRPPERGERREFFRKKIAGTLRLLLGIAPPEWKPFVAFLRFHDLASYDVVNYHDSGMHVVAPSIIHPNLVWMMNDLPARDHLTGKIFLGGIRSAIHAFLLRRCLRTVRTIVVLDRRNADLCRRFLRCTACIVRSGIDLRSFDGIPDTRKTAPPLRIFASNALYPHRRFEDLLEAVALLAEQGIPCHLHLNTVPSDAAYGAFLDRRIRELGLQGRLLRTYGLTETEFRQALRSAHVFVFPNDPQTWGLTVFEAMLAGCACIVSASCGAAEVLTHGVHALIVPPRSPAEIAKFLKRFAEDPALRANVASAGQDFVRRSLSWETYAQQMKSIFLLGRADEDRESLLGDEGGFPVEIP